MILPYIILLTILMLAIVILIGYSRYKESDDTFWAIAIPFCVAFGIACMYKSVKNEAEKNDKVEYIKQDPTQLSYSSPALYMLVTDDAAMTTVNAEMQFVAASQENILRDNTTLSFKKIYAYMRDGPSVKPEYIDDT